MLFIPHRKKIPKNREAELLFFIHPAAPKNGCTPLLKTTPYTGPVTKNRSVIWVLERGNTKTNYNGIDPENKGSMFLHFTVNVLKTNPKNNYGIVAPLKIPQKTGPHRAMSMEYNDEKKITASLRPKIGWS